MREALQLLVDGLAEGSRIALVAVGFSLIYGVTKTLHLAHGAIITLGAYLIWWSASVLSAPLPVALAIAAVAMVLLGMGHERFLYRNVRRPSTSNLIIIVAALGAGILLQNLVGVIFGFDTKSIRDATLGAATGGLQVAGVAIPYTDLGAFVVAILVFGALVAFLRYTKMGRRIRAVEANPLLSSVVGVDYRRVYVWTFGIGSLVALPASFFIGLNSGLFTTIGFDAMMIGFVVAFAGGVGSLSGTFFASLLIGAVQSLSLLLIPSSWQQAFTFALMLLILLARPQGLFGKAA